MLNALRFSLALLAAPLCAEEISVPTATTPLVLPDTPRKIAVYDLSALDTLDALGIPVAGVPQPVFLPYLENAAKGAQPVGSLFEPDFEALFALNPDLVIAGGRSAKQVPELAKIAPTADMTIWADPVSEGLARLETYAALFDKETEAKALRRALQDSLAQLKTLGETQGSALIVMTNGPKISAYGPKGRFGWLHRVTGLAPAAEVENSNHGEAISFEFIQKANPDVLLVIDRLAAIGRGGARAQETLDNALVREIKAWKTGKVIYLNAGPLYIANGGIQSMSGTVRELIEGLSD